EVPLPHRALHVDDRMAGQAAQAVLRLRGVDLLLDRPVETAVEEDRVVVAPRAPLRGLGPHHVLPVLDGLPVPLLVEGREVQGGEAPRAARARGEEGPPGRPGRCASTGPTARAGWRRPPSGTRRRRWPP